MTERAIMQQVDGHPGIILNSRSDGRGSDVGEVCNGQVVTVISRHGHYAHVQGVQINGYARVENLLFDGSETVRDESNGRNPDAQSAPPEHWGNPSLFEKREDWW